MAQATGPAAMPEPLIGPLKAVTPTALKPHRSRPDPTASSLHPSAWRRLPQLRHAPQGRHPGGGGYRTRFADLSWDGGVGQPFAPARRVFKEWVSVPQRDRRRWRSLLREGIAFVAPR